MQKKHCCVSAALPRRHWADPNAAPCATAFVRGLAPVLRTPPGCFEIREAVFLAELPRLAEFDAVFLDVGVLLGLSCGKRGNHDPVSEAV